MRLYQYWHELSRRWSTGSRYGQDAYNLLAEVRPGLAEQLRGTDIDPFYAEGFQDRRMVAFAKWLDENWEK